MPLETRINEVERRIAALEGSHDLLIQLAERIEAMRDDIVEIKAAAVETNRALDGDREQYAKQRREDEQQAKSDRHWLIGTIVASSAFIVSAVGLIVGNIG